MPIADRRRRPGARRSRLRAVGAATTRRETAGFSLVEVLITAVMVLAVALSTIPMFTRSMVNNTAGKDATEVANEARRQLERLLELPFGNPELVLLGGTERETSEYFSLLDRAWHAYPLPAGSAGVLWTRITTVRQYALPALSDGVLETAEALAFDAHPEAVHMKEIEVRVEQAGSAFGPSKRITLRTLKVK
jgi:hypothetical protein